MRKINKAILSPFSAIENHFIFIPDLYVRLFSQGIKGNAYFQKLMRANKIYHIRKCEWP